MTEKCPVTISTQPCGHCEGSGVQPSAQMVEEVQCAIERGLLDMDGVLKLIATMYEQAALLKHRTELSE